MTTSLVFSGVKPQIEPVTTPEGAAIATKGVEMVYQTQAGRFPILKGIDLEIPYGSVEILMGPSGSGKTTLLTILAGLLTPTSGSVKLLGQEITTMSRKQLAKFRLHHIGFVFQDFNLFPALTAAENIEMAFHLKGIRGREARRQTQSLLEQVDLGDKGGNLPSQLSGGQKQRVAIARALVGRPQLIMADEPTASLDSQSGYTVVQLLRQLAREAGCTVLMVTHDPRILDLADRVIHLEDGKLAQSPTIQEVHSR
ncbi:ABC transporter ATP-binding protein [Gloeothece verrucosa]|uniref:ABC transporter related protein n=1 Tax=Gloeothece verrucosa (strain PCC 7822) TaxID=497965 RepID=E0UA22_GLOV7|nr:ABC transporter ATP-binding protein [Gloeothece verrucosa]ADN16214.1 ABC transporter related protein [Gloeothece verrucosa PCC 7822]